MTSPPAAILVSDIHLWNKPPIAREDEWFAAMQRSISQLQELQQSHSSQNTLLPIICAGDVFDRANAPAEIVNFALLHLPHMIAVPGQHDLPYHNLEDIKKSSFWTLVEAKKITYLEPGKPVAIGPLVLRGFPFGVPVTPLKDRHSLALEIAVIHSCIWTKSTAFPRAPQDARLKAWKKRLAGFDVAVFGDNHKSFTAMLGDCRVVNCGGFMRRKSDEKNYDPSVWLLREDRTVERIRLDCSKDKFAKLDLEGISDNSEEFLQTLSNLGEQCLDFREAVMHSLDSLPEKARKIVVKVMKNG